MRPLRPLARLAVAALWVAAWGVPGVVQAQVPGQTIPGTEGVGLIERLGRKVPPGFTFTDERGATVRIGDYLGKGKPVVLTLVYYNCPMLCSLVLDGFTDAMKNVSATPGQDFTVLTVSFEPRETTAQAVRQQRRHVQMLGRPEAVLGWHFMTGTQANIHGLADAVGFKYRWDPASGQYAHPATLIFLAPDGTITRYLPGLSYASRDVRLALNEASEGKIGTVLDQFLMLCYQYDPSKGSYVPLATNVMKLGGGLFLALAGLTLAVLWRRDRTESPLSTLPS